MVKKPYLVFTLHHSLYALEALVVQEIFFLPALTKIVESPGDIVGIINLRGDIVPIIDLRSRFGYPAQKYVLTDSVIILLWQGVKLGLIVNQVHEVQIVSSEQISIELSQGIALGQNINHFVYGFAKVESDIILLLNPERLIDSIRNQNLQDFSENQFQKNLLIEDTHGGGESRGLEFVEDPQELLIFQQRAQNLMRQTESQDFSGLIALSVVGLNGEYFGLHLEAVREFTDVRKVTPVPCTPPHIVGNMNLRGEILTLIDIRGILNMSMNNAEKLVKAIIVEFEDLVVGVVVDQVFDVMYLQQSDLKTIPTMVHSKYEEYLKGTAPYHHKMMAILDLPKILTQGRLFVDEEVV